MKNNITQGRPYPQGTMYSAVLAAAETKPDSVAYDFMGKETVYNMVAIFPWVNESNWLLYYFTLAVIPFNLLLSSSKKASCSLDKPIFVPNS